MLHSAYLTEVAQGIHTVHTEYIVCKEPGFLNDKSNLRIKLSSSFHIDTGYDLGAES